MIKRCWLCNGKGWYLCYNKKCRRQHNKFREHRCIDCNGTGIGDEKIAFSPSSKAHQALERIRQKEIQAKSLS